MDKMDTIIETPRLILRKWREGDIEPFARLNADQQVMEFFLKTLSREETLGFYQRIQEEFTARGYGLYAVERKDDRAFIGYVGLHYFDFEASFAPGVEIGWRLMAGAWGQGYATEAASACLEYAREQLHLEQVYSFTTLTNKRSERVMQKIGLQRLGEFGHPLVAPSHPLYRHVLYGLKPA